VPLDGFAAAAPLVVEFGVVEAGRLAQQVERNVGDWAAQRQLMERRMAIDGVREATQTWLLGGVVGLEVERAVALGERPAGFDELVAGSS